MVAERLKRRQVDGISKCVGLKHRVFGHVLWECVDLAFSTSYVLLKRPESYWMGAETLKRRRVDGISKMFGACESGLSQCLTCPETVQNNFGWGPKDRSPIELFESHFLWGLEHRGFGHVSWVGVNLAFLNVILAPKRPTIIVRGGRKLGVLENGWNLRRSRICPHCR